VRVPSGVLLDNSRQPTADSRQQITDSRQQTTDNRQQATDSRQQTAGSRQQTAQKSVIRMEQKDGWKSESSRSEL